VGFYENRVLPHILNFAMNTKGVRAERAKCLEHTSGEVLEIGFGSGLNLPYYPSTVTKVLGVDPSKQSARLGRKRISAARFPVEVVELSAERLPLPDAAYQSVVSTFTLCTIPDVAAALDEVRRVLGPGGRFYFVEHGRADDFGVRRWQDRLNSIQQSVFGGCHLNRNISGLIEQAGFRIERLEHDYMKGSPRFAGYLHRGVAQRI